MSWDQKPLGDQKHPFLGVRKGGAQREVGTLASAAGSRSKHVPHTA